MFCRNCGSKNEDGAMFCRECGAKLVVDSNASGTNTVTNPTPIIVPNNTQQNENPAGSFIEMFKSIPKKILYGIAGGIVAIAVIAIILININSTINLDKYVEVTYEGYEGYGRATVSIDWASIQNKYGSKLKYTNAGASMYGNYEAPVDALSDFISTPTLDNSIGLKNDDEITYTWNIDEDELSKYIKCKVKYKDKTLTVSGLEEVETFDAFESLDVTFNGVGPAGYVTYEYNGEIFDTYDFYADKESGLSNGDVVTISIGIDDLEYFADNYGKIPAETSKEYTVEGLGRYLTKTSEISDDTLNEVKTKVESIISDYTGSWSSDATVDGVTYLGIYVAASNDSDSYDHNYLGVVYQIDSHVQASADYDAVSVTQYYDVAFNNVAVKDDGFVEMDLESYSTPRNSFSKKAYYGKYSFNYRNYTYYGYESLGAMVQNRTGYYGEEFTYDWNVEGLDADNLTAETEDYLCSYSAEREITREEIDTYMSTDYSSYNFPGDRTIVQMIINEMYARHGYEFTDDELTQYFNNKEWYSSIDDKTNDMDKIYKGMSSVEQANVTLLQEYQ